MWNPSGWDKNSRNVGVLIGFGVAVAAAAVVVVVMNGNISIPNIGKWMMITAKERRSGGRSAVEGNTLMANMIMETTRSGKIAKVVVQRLVVTTAFCASSPS